MREAERWTVHTRRLPPPAVSHYVRIQNQTGPHPNKWDETDIIIEVRQFDQHAVRVDGCGRITLRNRKFLRRYIPVQAPQPQHTIYVDFRYTTQLLAKPAASPSQSFQKFAFFVYYITKNLIYSAHFQLEYWNLLFEQK